MRSAFLVIALAAVLSGCAAGEPGLPAGGGDHPAAAGPVLIAQAEWSGSAADLACATGGSSVPREQGVHVNGTRKLLVEVEMAPTWTGIDVGYAYDEEETVWFASFGPPGGSAEIPVDPTQWESRTRKNVWTFPYRFNVAAAPQDCYTGAGTGTMSIRIVAE